MGSQTDRLTVPRDKISNPTVILCTFGFRPGSDAELRPPTIAWPTMRNTMSSAFKPELQGRLALCQVTRAMVAPPTRQFHW